MVKQERQYLVIFLATFSILIAGAVWSSSRMESFRETPINFYDFSDETIYISYGLTRRQSSAVKLGFSEQFEPPDVGLFGNHQFKFFSAEAFGPNVPNRYFFNYWYANLGLPELRDYLKHLAKLGKLPKKRILIQITTPNNDNGRYIARYNGELAPDLVNFGDFSDVQEFIGKLTHRYVGLRNEIAHTLDYASVLIGMVGPQGKARILKKSDCRDGKIGSQQPRSAYIRYMPITVRNALLPDDPRKFCDPAIFWGTALRNDGSTLLENHSRWTLKLNQNPLRPEHSYLKFGDEKRIAKFIREIQDIATRAGVKIAFIIPPVYETNRKSIANTVFSQALLRLKGVEIIDHRKYGTKEEFFLNYDHPKPTYYRFLVQELRERNLLPVLDSSGS